MKAMAKQLLFAVLLLCELVVLTPQAHAQGGIPLWTNRYNGPGNANDVAYALAVHSSGDVVVTGYSYSADSSADYSTIKYSNAGVPVWTNRYDGPGLDYDVATAVAVNHDGDVFVTGYSTDTNAFFNYATIAYSSAGIPLWTNRYHGPGNHDSAYAVIVDNSGDVLVTGESRNGTNNPDYATIKYSGAGLPLWTNRYNGPANKHDYALAMAVDSSGNSFVTGSSGGFSVNDTEYATVAYSAAGIPLWTNRYSGPGNGDAKAIAVDNGGKVFVTGESFGAGTGDDYATIAYSTAGVPLWTNRYNGPANRFDWAEAITVDSNGDVLVTGASDGIGTSSDYATIKYSSSGVPMWTNRYDLGSSNNRAYAIAVDNNGSVFVTGSSGTVAYSRAGVPLWTDVSGIVGHAIGMDSYGNVFVTGFSIGSGLDYAAIKYSSSVPAIHLAIERDNSDGFFIRVTSVPNTTCRLQRSPNVTGSWSDIATNTLMSAFTEFHDTNASSGQMFYRAVLVP